MRKLIRRQSGLSLIEIMVALTLSLILTLGLVHIFTSNSQSFRLAEASSRIQESGRMALGILSREIRNADYWGCLQDTSDLNNMLNTGSSFNVEALMRGVDAENNVGPGGSDMLYLGGVAGGAEAKVTFVPSPGAATMAVDDSSSLTVGDILIVTNCKAGDIFQMTGPSSSSSVQVVHNTGTVSSGGPGNATQTLSLDYNQDPGGGGIFRPRQQRFYLVDNATDGRRELITDGVNVRAGATSGTITGASALMSNVVNFQLQFGVDTNGNGRVNVWEDPIGLTAAGRQQADRAIAIRTSFLIRSDRDGLTDGSQSFCFPGWLDCEDDASLLSTAADTFLYRVYTTTTSLRNRVGG